MTGEDFAFFHWKRNGVAVCDHPACHGCMLNWDRGRR